MSQNESSTESGTGEYESTEYDTATNDDGTTITTAVKSVENPQTRQNNEEESVASGSVASFFEANKAPESDYQAKQRELKELEERKKKRQEERARMLKENPDYIPKDNTAPIAPEHYTVELKRREWDDDLKLFREKQRKLLKNIRLTSKRKVAALHERIFFTIRWANPELPSIFKKIIMEYCAHLMGPYPERKYLKVGVLHAWFSKFSHTAEAKVVEEVKGLCERLRVLVLKRDDKTVKTIVKLEQKTELMTIQKEGDVRWHMETMHCARDDYWTIWYLCRRNLTLELLRMLETCKDVDVRDPDFGYTPLHYACRENHWDIFSILLKHGASEKAVIEEDGRQPLHLAAQYGTKNMCLELLAVGADYYAKDKYGSTPLDLAIQSKNYPVITVLQNWTQLLPPEEVKVEEAVDLSEVPEEFMSTPYEVLLTMSPALRVITTRLEGNDVTATHSMDSGMEVGVEIRLCERRCNMCIDEGFAFEAMKSRKRRWTVAKNGYLKQLEAAVIASKGNLCADSETSVSQEEGLGGSTSLLATKEGDAPLKSITESANENKEESDRSISTGKTGRTLVKRTPPKLTASLLYSICSELFENLIREKSYEEAERVMTDGLAVIELDDATRVTCLKRHAQLLLFLSDKISKDEKTLSSVIHDSMPVGAHSRSNPSKNNAPVDHSFAPEEFNHTTSYASLNVSDDDSRNYGDRDPLHDTAPISMAEPSIQQGSIMIHPSATAPYRVESVSQSQHDHSAVEPAMQTSHVFKDSAANYNMASQSLVIPQNISAYDIILMRAEGDINEGLELLRKNYDFNFIEPVALSPLLELAAEIADRQGRYVDALHFMEHAGTVKERTLGQAHSDTVRVFIESLRLLLRKQLVLASQRKSQRDIITKAEEDILNESISSKLMNEKKISKIREIRNKKAKAEDKKYFSEVGQQATDVSRRLDRLSLENEDEALKLSTKCYNLVSLTELIVQGEIDPNQVLPVTGESMSLQSLNSKLFPTQMIRALDRSTFNESDLARA
jgi:hypothetical protein